MSRALRFAAVMLSVLAAPAVASAEDSPLAAYFGNTLLTNKDGDEASFFFEPDGSFTNSFGTSGQWSVANDQLCFDYSSESAVDICIPFVAGKVAGDTWDQADSDGATMTMTLVQGR